MLDQCQSLTHPKWDCKDPVVFVPKARRAAVSGQMRQPLGVIFHALARHKECDIVEGHVRADHVHLLMRMPPQYSVASVLGLLTGRAALARARPLSGRTRTFKGEKFWARGYAVSTVGFNRGAPPQLHSQPEWRQGRGPCLQALKAVWARRATSPGRWPPSGLDHRAVW
jgi:putative transposase